jgi:hypothetical protein
VECSDLEAPGVRERVAHIFADHQQGGMRERYHTLFKRLAFSRDSKLDVNGIGMPDGDARLKPIKMSPPNAPERIGPDLKLAKILNHLG